VRFTRYELAARDHTGFVYSQSGDRLVLGYLREGHREGPHFAWGDAGVEVQWSRCPRLSFAESTHHGPTWRWRPDGAPLHEAFFEHYHCLRQQGFVGGERRPSQRYSAPEPWNLWNARQSPVRDVAYWNDDGTIGYAPLFDPGMPARLPEALRRPEVHDPRVIRSLAPLTRRVRFEPPGRLRDLLAALEARANAEPHDLAAWSVLADAQIEAGHPEGVSASLIVTILRADDVARALEAAMRLGPVEDWVWRTVQRVWAHGDRRCVEEAARALGVRLPPEAQAELRALAERASLDLGDGLRAIAAVARPGPWTAPSIPPSGSRVGWVGRPIDDRCVEIGVTSEGSTAIRLARTTPLLQDTAVPPVAIPERVHERYRRFVQGGQP